MLDWLKNHVWLLVLVSVAVAIVASIVGVAILLELPPDHFKQHHDDSKTNRGAALRITVFILKNTVGLFFLVVGDCSRSPWSPAQASFSSSSVSR